MTSVLIVHDGLPAPVRLRAVFEGAGHDVMSLALGDNPRVNAALERSEIVLVVPGTTGGSLSEFLRAFRANLSATGAGVIVVLPTGAPDRLSEAIGAEVDDVIELDALECLLLWRVERVLHNRRLAAMARLHENLVQTGRLLVGVVHEIRGPLSVIRGSTELLRYQLGADHPLQTTVEPILRNTQVLQVRLEHLMASARGGRPRIETTDARQIVVEACTLFLRGVDPRGCPVKIDHESSDSVPSVAVDAGRLLLVLLSLLGNAHEAMLEAGRSAGSIEVRVALAAETDENWVAISLDDDGPGIPATILDRVFEPFFTTKEHGTGFGLYLAAQALKEQGGRISATNRPEGGARFTLWLRPSRAETSAEPIRGVGAGPSEKGPLPR